jgi:hypothetical protein
MWHEFLHLVDGFYEMFMVMREETPKGLIKMALLQKKRGAAPDPTRARLNG